MDSESDEAVKVVYYPFGEMQVQDLQKQLNVWSESEVFYLAAPWFRRKYGDNIFFAAPWLKSESSSKGWKLFQVDLYGTRDSCADFYELKGQYRTWLEKLSQGIRSPEIPMQCVYYEYLLVNNCLDPDLKVILGKFLHFGQEMKSYTFNYMVSLRAYDKAKQAGSLKLLENLGYGLIVVRRYDDCFEVVSPITYKLDDATTKQRLNVLEAELRHYGKIQKANRKT